MKCSRLIIVTLASALMLVGCGTDSLPAASGGSNGAGSETNTSDGGNAAPGDTDASPGDAGDSGDPGGAGDAPDAGSAGDYLRLEGQELSFAFAEYTIDESHDVSSVATSMYICSPNGADTGVFRAAGFLVDDANSVIFDEFSWRGHAYFALPFDDTVAADEHPIVQLELNDRGLVLTTSNTDPAAVAGTFSVDGTTATGDFMVPDLNGGAPQHLEFRVTCPAGE